VRACVQVQRARAVPMAPPNLVDEILRLRPEFFNPARRPELWDAVYRLVALRWRNTSITAQDSLRNPAKF
jgi:hypothetical protein